MQIRVGREHYTVRPAHTGGLAKIRKIVPMPSRIPEMLGLTAFRGVILPVFDLAGLLGIPSDVGAPEWLLLSAGDPSLGLAFQEFEGQEVRELPGGERRPEPRESGVELVRVGQAIRPVLDIPGLIESIRVRAGVSGNLKEKKQ